MRLARVGIENLAGFLEGSVMAWERAGLPLSQVPQISVLDLYQQLCDQPAEIQVVDVRNPLEWESGHIAQATLKPLGRFALGASDALKSLLVDLSPAKPVAVHCKSGYRSSIATSLLERAGYRGVLNVVGGFDAWQAHKLPVERSGTSREPEAPSPPASAGGS